MKSKLFPAFILCWALRAFLPAQGYPVLDIANLIQAIDSLYASYDHIMYTIEQVQNTFKQLEKQYEMVKNMNWDDMPDDIDFTTAEGILRFRGQLKDMGAILNRNMNRVNAVQDTLHKKKIKFGGKSYTMAGLFGIGEPGEPTLFDLPMNVVDFVNQSADSVTAGYEGKLTEKQKNAVMRKYGVSARNYAKLRYADTLATDITKRLLTTGSQEHSNALIEQTIEDNKALEEMTKAAGDSMTAQVSASSQILLSLRLEMAEFENAFNEYVGYTVTKQISEQAKEETLADERLLASEREAKDSRTISVVPEMY